MKRLLAVIAVFAASILAGCSSLPQSSGSIHPAVLTQDINDELGNVTIIFDGTARGNHTFEVAHELPSNQAVKIVFACPQEDQTIGFSAQAGSTELWGGSASACNSDFSNKTTFNTGDNDSMSNWDLIVTTSEKTDYRVVIYTENP